MNWDEAKEIIHEKSDWEELAEECSILVKKIGLTKEDSDQIVYKVRHPEWDQIRADILMLMFEQNLEIKHYNSGTLYMMDELGEWKSLGKVYDIKARY